jgi:acetyl-CoA carboxylase carboxyltransferase component
VFHPGGASFRHIAERSKAGIPTATIVFGSSTAGGAYTPGMSDYVIMVKVRLSRSIIHWYDIHLESSASVFGRTAFGANGHG